MLFFLFLSFSKKEVTYNNIDKSKMKLKNHNFVVNELISIQLDKRLSYPILNFSLLSQYINYRTYRLNKRYKELLPVKIEKLKEVKNTLLEFRFYYQNYNTEVSKEDYYKLHNDFRNDFPIIYKELVSSGVLCNDTQRGEINKVHRYKNYILGLSHTIKKIDTAIKKYQKDLNKKRPRFLYNITQYDIYMLSCGVVTPNVKKLSYFYYIKLKKNRVSKRTTDYLNLPIVKNRINNISQSDIKQIVNTEIDIFSNHFLTKTI